MAEEGDGFLPVRLVGSDKAGNEKHIGDFEKGIVFKGSVISDVLTQAPVAHLRKIGETTLVWEVPHLKTVFLYVFAQVMPSDAPVELDIPGGGRQVFY